uniref:ATP-dependent DNA helicase n=1 Tax=Lactuca sativa TaxID=4236 RepID=A0A9R1UFM5_LACSA|nr:hypothetical protein LSAT_V11C900480510 [Lactuca sativa]
MGITTFIFMHKKKGNNRKNITTVIKLVSFTIVVIFPYVRHVGDFLGMTFIIEHRLSKDCRFILNTNSLLSLKHTNKLLKLFLNPLSLLLHLRPGRNVPNMMQMHGNYHMLNSQLNILKLKLDAIFNLTLSYIEKSLLSCGVSLKQIPNMPFPGHRYIQESYNMLIQDELNCDPPILEVEHEDLHSKLNVKQKNNWKYIYLEDLVCCYLIQSGIVALLLSGGRTTHSRFNISINLNKDSFCSIVPDDNLTTLLNKVRLIIWDEALMMHRHCFEAFDMTLRDIIRSSDMHKLFGGKTITSLHSSRLWHECIILRLTINMRLQVGSPTNDLDETKTFVEWILKISECNIGGPNDGESQVEFSEDIIVRFIGDHIHSIVSIIYLYFENHIDDPSYFKIKLFWSLQMKMLMLSMTTN